MESNGYAIVMGYYDQFELRYYNDVNDPTVWQVIEVSFSYDVIMRALIKNRALRGMDKEYWIS